MADENFLEQTRKLYDLNHSINHLLHQYITKNTNISLSPAQCWFLRLLKKNGTCTPSDVAQIMGVTSGAITSLADRLYKQELINRERSKRDRRVVELSLTSKGKEMILELEQELLKHLTEIWSRLSDEDIKITSYIFTKVKNILEELLSEGQRSE